MTPAVLEALLDARVAKRSAVLATDLATGHQVLMLADAGTVAAGALVPTEALAAEAARARRSDRSGVAEVDGRKLFLQVFNPPLRLIVVGAVHIAQALVPMAALADYDVTVVDPRRAFASDERFPAVKVVREWPDEALDALAPDGRAAVVTLTHDPKLDDPALDRALRSEAFYIAALGSTRTHAARLERLGRLGHDQAALARVHGPAGLPLGAVSPAEIAIAVLAQMTQVLHRREAT